jgi:hypothetical protein
MKKPAKFPRATNKSADVEDSKAKEERNAKAAARREEFEAAVKKLQESDVWQPFVALHDAIKTLPTPDERRLVATTLARLLRRPAGAKREERLKLRLAKLKEQAAKVEEQLKTSVA